MSGEHTGGMQDPEHGKSEKNIQGLLLQPPPQSELPPEVLELYKAAVAKGREAMGWYAKRKEGKKWWGRKLRLSALLLGALASITPILVQLLPREEPYQRWSLLASVFAVLSATCVGLDNYLGASSGWMRYVSSYLELSSRLESFQFGWTRLALVAPTVPKEQRLSVALDLLLGFITSVNAVIQQETQEWIAEFRGHLALLEQRMEAHRAALAAAPSGTYGAIKVQVENADKLRDGRWRVVLGTGREFEGTGGSTVVATGLGPGLLAIHLDAVAKDGKQYVTEDVVSIRAGEVTAYTFRVP